ncbi:MAG: tol-pal system protein YbgF [Alphaproteobacteria bacterium]
MKKLWSAVAILFGLSLFWLSAERAVAQDYESLRNQIDQLRQQVRQLSGQVNDLSRGGGASLAASGGEGGSSAQVLARLDEVVETMRRLNGRVEELEFKVGNLSSGLDALKRDVDLSAAKPQQSEPPPTETSDGVSYVGEAADAGAGTGASGAGASSAPAGDGYDANQAPRPLGSMPLDPDSPPPSPAADTPRVAEPPAAPEEDTAVAAATPATPKEQYDAAHRLLKNAQYGEAEAAFRSFIEGNEGDPNVERASYWLAETYYARKEFDQAYQVYARNLQQWPKGDKAPDNLVKLSLSLVNLKRDKEACQFLAVLDSDYPNAGANVKQAADRAKSLAKCS